MPHYVTENKGFFLYILEFVCMINHSFMISLTIKLNNYSIFFLIVKRNFLYPKADFVPKKILIFFPHI